MGDRDNKPWENTVLAKAWKIERLKFGFQYALTLLSALALGLLLFRAVGDSFLPSWQSEIVARHFSLPFSSRPTFFPVLSVTISLTLPVLLGMGIVLLFCFSSLNCLLNDLVLIYFGMRTGYTVSVLLSALFDSSEAVYPVSWIEFWLFLFLKIATLCLLWIYAFRASECSYYLRMYSHNGRALFHPRTVLRLFLYTLASMTLMLVLHIVYCGLLHAL